jgi:predicted nucleotidyltransferase
MLPRLVGSRTRAHLLELFLLHPDQEYHVRAAARATGENITAVRRELANLSDLGLLASRSQGTLRLYRARRDSPLYPELQRLVLKTSGIAEEVKASLGGLEGLSRLFIFGSMANATAGPESDLDLCIVGEVDEDRLIGAIADLEARLGREVNYVLYTRDEFEARRSGGDLFIGHVLSQPRIDLVGGGGDDD